MVDVIAIDGPAGAGKGTIAKFLSQKLKFPYIDTGLFYRALAFKALGAHVPYDNEVMLIDLAESVGLDDLENDLLRDESVASVASQTSVHPRIREILTNKMRSEALRIAEKSGGVILDGRDVSTVIFPNATTKLFIIADENTREQRRLQEMQKKGLMVKDGALSERDKRDQSRKTSPLKKAADAHTIDTTYLSIEEACAKALSFI
ncbi:MAG: cytidylate kinase [Alphaproteobacteria bacterium CG_4_10_14_0_8_um_filter_37_21]|nr:MAG: cytidylate kinase [Alphaproteobacteria bacterium CG_4_10_14_0_8_um_filter_37_21]